MQQNSSYIQLLQLLAAYTFYINLLYKVILWEKKREGISDNLIWKMCARGLPAVLLLLMHIQSTGLDHS